MYFSGFSIRRKQLLYSHTSFTNISIRCVSPRPYHITAPVQQRQKHGSTAYLIARLLSNPREIDLHKTKYILFRHRLFIINMSHLITELANKTLLKNHLKIETLYYFPSQMSDYKNKSID